MFYDEREAIRQELEFNRQERMDLNQRYWEERSILRNRHEILMERLRELDEQDKGLFTNKTIKTTTSIEEHRETMRIHNEQSQMPWEIEEPIKTNLQSHINRADSLEKQDKDNTIKKSKLHDLKKTSDIVAAYMREVGRPIKIKEVFSYLELNHELTWSKNSHSFTFKSFTNYHPRIQKVEGTHGYYQYKV